MDILIGIDDTDNKDSRGTGFRARQLGQLIEAKGLGEILGISRHQLYVHDLIPYTSKNSSACLEVNNISAYDKLNNLCREFLLEDSAPGSDAGLAVAVSSEISEEIMNWGNKAKVEILKKTTAYELALKNNISLEGLTGDKIGIIGALAAIGLRKGGNDGRFIWLKGIELREISGIYTKQELTKILRFDDVITEKFDSINNNENILLEYWIRPVLKQNKIYIFVEKVENNGKYKWKIKSKDYIRSISE
ncbi:hypothetical protein ACFLRW_04295 [Acidobacteriota bacterium]